MALITRELSTPYDLQSKAGISQGASLPALRRLEASGFVIKGEESARRRLEYQVTGRGKKHLESSWKALLQSRTGDFDDLLRAACVGLLMGERVKVVAQYLADASRQRKSVGPASFSGGPGLRDPGLYAWMKQAGNPVRAKSEAAILKKMASFLKKARK